jgi:hypothetical protein
MLFASKEYLLPFKAQSLFRHFTQELKRQMQLVVFDPSNGGGRMPRPEHLNQPGTILESFWRQRNGKKKSQSGSCWLMQ